MNKISKIKRIIDILMTLSFLMALNFQLFGGHMHKCIAAILLFLFVLHNALNWRWYGTIFRGKYSKIRLVHTITNICVLLGIIMIIYSGVLLTKETALGDVTGKLSLARFLHIAGSYWSLAAIAVHLGIHLKGKYIHDR